MSLRTGISIISTRLLLSLPLLAGVVLQSCSGGASLVDSFVGGTGGGTAQVAVSDLALRPSTELYDFGNVSTLATPVSGSITLRNYSDKTIYIGTLTPSADLNFTLVSNSCPTGASGLSAGATCTLLVHYKPLAAGQQTYGFPVPFGEQVAAYSFQANVGFTGTGVQPLTFTGLDPISIPTVTTAKAGLTWPSVSGAASIVIYQVNPGPVLSVLTTLPGTATATTLTGLTDGTTYTVRAVALNAVGDPDGNTLDRTFTTDLVGTFGTIPALAASENVTATTGSLATYCTDSESNVPSFMAITAQSDPDSQCTLLTSPYRIQCTPNFKTAHAGWSSTVSISCLLNDYPNPLAQTLTVNVSDTNRAPIVTPISSQSVLAATAITPINVLASDPDGDSMTYTCQYDTLVDGTVLGAAAACSTLLQNGGGFATFSAGTLSWTPAIALAGQTYEIKVGANDGLTSSSSIFTITVGQPPPSSATSLVSVSSGTVNSGSGVTVTVQAKDSGGNNLLQGGATVTFGTTGGTSTGTFGSVVDNHDGTYTTTFTGVLSGSAITIQGSIQGNLVTTTAPTVAVNPGPISPTKSVVSVASSTVVSGTTVNVSLQGKDAAGNNVVVGGSTVAFTRAGGTSTGSFSATNDTGTGLYTATFSGLVAGTATQIGATIGGVAVTTSLPGETVVPGAVSLSQSLVSVVGGATTLASGSQVSVKLVAKDAAGNSLTSGGLTIVFTTTGGTSTGTFGTVVDNGDGTYGAVFTGIASGSPTSMGATIGGLAVTSTSPQLAVIAGGVSLAMSTVSFSSGSIASGATSIATVSVRDSNGNLLSGGQTVTLLLSTGAGVSAATISSVTDHSDGTFTATLTGTASGTASTLTAKIGGVALTSVLPTLTVTPGATSLVSSTVTAGSATIASGATSLLTLTLRDTYGNPTGTAGQTVVFSRTGGTSTGIFGAVADVGNGTYTSIFSGVVSGTATQIAVTVGGLPLTGGSIPTITVIPGAISLSQSTISASSGTVVAGSTATLTLDAKDANGNHLTAGGQTVLFSFTGGVSTGSIGTVNDLGNGFYSATFTGLLAGTPSNVGATVGGSAVTSTQPTIQVNPGSVSLAQSVISVSSGSIQSGSGSTLTLTTKDGGGNLLTSGGLTVAFSNTGGTSTGTIGAVADVGNGTYTAIFTGVLAGTATTIRATIGGSLLSSTFPTITVSPGPVSLAQSRVTVTGSVTTLASSSSVGVTLTAKDAAGNQLTSGGLTVVLNGTGGTSTGNFSAVVDNSNGTYSSTFTGVVSGTALSMGATVGGFAVTSTLPTLAVIPGAVSLSNSTVALSSGSINSGATTTATVAVRDANGNPVGGGQAVTLVLSAGGGVSVATISVITDNADGTYTATLTGTASGTATTVTAKIAGASITSVLPTLTVFPGAISLVGTTVSAGATTISSGSGTTLTLTLRDAFGNATGTAGQTIVFNRTGGTSTGNFSAVNDLGNGTYTTTFTGVVSGTSTQIGATVSGSALTNGSIPAITVTPGAISLAQSLITTSTGTVTSGATAILTLHAKDAAANAITIGGQTVLFSVTGGGSAGTISGISDLGNGNYTATFTATTAGTPSTVGSTVGGAGVTSVAPTVQVNPGAVSLVQSLVSVSSGAITSGGTSTLTLTAKDAGGNVLTAGGLTVAFSTNGGSSTGTISGTTDNGNGTYTAVLTGVLAGTATTIRATIGGTLLSSTFPTVTVSPGVISLTQSTVTVSGSVTSIAAGTGVGVQLTAKDAAGNQLTTGGLTVVFTATGGTSTGNFSGFVDHSNGAYTATFNGTGIGSALSIGATVGGLSLTSTLPALSVIPGPVSLSGSALALSSGAIISGATSTATVTVVDALGNPIVGQTTALQLSTGGGVGAATISALVDNGNGTYTATLTGTTSGTAITVTAKVGGLALTSTAPTLTVSPGAISLSSSTVTSGATTISSGATTLLTLTLRDTFGNPTGTAGQTIVFNRTGGTSTGTFAAVTDVGNGTYTSVFTAVASGSATQIGATIGGAAVTNGSHPSITVNPGALSLTQSTISTSAAILASGGTATLTLVAKDAAGNNLTAGGQTVVFSVTGGASAGTLSATSDLSNGTYTAIFTATTSGSPSTVGVTAGGSAVTSAAPTIQVNPSGVSLAQSLVSVSSGSVASGSAATLTLTAKDASGNTLTSGGLSVAFSFTGGTSTGTIGGVTDVGNGTYTAPFTGVISGSATTIRATIGGTLISSTFPTLSVTPGTVSLAQSTVAVTGAPTFITSGSTVGVQLSVRDAVGNQLTTGGHTVTFSYSGGGSTGTIGGVVDNANGTYSSSITGAAAGSISLVGATIGGLSVTSTLPNLSVVPGGLSAASSAVTLGAASVVSGATTSVTIAAKDAFGNSLGTGGLSTAISLTTGTSAGTFTAASDLGTGTYTSTFTGTSAGTAGQVHVSLSGTNLASAPSLQVTVGVISLAGSTISAGSNSIVSGTSTALTLTIRDAAGNPTGTSGAAIIFTRTGGTSTGTFGPVTDNGDGTYSSSFSGIVAGTATQIGATINGAAMTNGALPQINVTPGSMSLSQSTVSDSSSVIASGTTAAFTLTTKDANGNNLITGGQIVVFTLSGGGTSTGSISAVTDVGNGSYTAVFTGIVAGTQLNIGATIAGATVTSLSPTIQVVPGAASLAQSLVSASLSTVVATSTATVTLDVKDAAGNHQTSGGLVVVFSTSGGTSTGTFNATSDGGNGVYTSTFTGVTPGTATSIRATIGGSLVTSTSPTIAVANGSPTLNTLTSLTYPTNPLYQGQTVNFDISNVSSGSPSDVGMLYDCVYDTVVDGSVAAGTPCTSLPGTPTLNTATGAFAWTPTNSAVGKYEMKFLGTNAYGTGTTIVVVDVRLVFAGLTSIATPALADQLTLNWTALTGPGVGGYRIYKDSGGSNFNLIQTMPGAGNTSYTVTGLTPATSYTFRVRAYDTLSPSGEDTNTSDLTLSTGSLGAPVAANSTITVSSATVTTATNVTVTVTLKDTVGNLRSGQSGVIALTQSGLGTSGSGTFSSITDAGNGVYTATFTGDVTGSSARTIGATVSAVAITPATAVTISSGPGTKLAYIGPTTVQAGTCTSAFNVVLQDAKGNLATSGSNTNVNLSGLGSGAFYTGSGCTSSTVSTVVFAGSSSSASLYYKNLGAANLTLTATDAVLLYTAASYAFSVTAVPGWIGVAGAPLIANASGAATGYDTFRGRYDGAMDTPLGVVRDGNFAYVSDSGNHRIHKWNWSTNTYIGWIGWISVSPTGGDPGCAGASAGTFTPGWCRGGYSVACNSTAAACDGGLNAPSHMAVSGTNLYVVDTTNARVVKYNKSTGVFGGWIGLVGASSPTAGACNGTQATLVTPGWCNTSGRSIARTATAANNGGFNAPRGITVDSTGNIYVTDSALFTIQKFTSAGAYVGYLGLMGAVAAGVPNAGACTGFTVTQATTVTPGWCWGSTAANGGYGQQVTTAMLPAGPTNYLDGALQGPRGLYIDETAGYLYVADAGWSRVARFTLSTGAPQGWMGFINNNSLVALPSSCSGGAPALNTTKGWCIGGVPGGGGGTTNMSGVRSLTGDGTYLYLSDSGNNRLDRWNQSTGLAVDWVGVASTTQPTGGVSGCVTLNFQQATPGWCSGGTNYPGYLERFFDTPDQIAFDGTYLFSADSNNHRVSVYKAVGGTYSGLLGAAQNSNATTWSTTFDTTQYLPSNGTKFDIGFYAPQGVVYDSTTGTLLIGDATNNRVKKHVASTGSLVGWIGVINYYPTGGGSSCASQSSGQTPGWCLGGTSTNGSGNGNFNGPTGITSDGTYFYVSDTGNNRVQKFAISDGGVVGWIGRANGTSPTDGACNGTQANQATPGWCLGGNMTTSGVGDGSFNGPRGLWVNTTNGYLYVADVSNNRINRYVASTGAFAGWVGRMASAAPNLPTNTATCLNPTVNSYTPGWCMTGTTQSCTLATCSGFNAPNAVTGDGSGSLFITDRANHRVVKIDETTGAITGWVGRIGATTPTGGTGCAGLTNQPTPGWCTGGLSATGTGNGEVANPIGIHADATYVYITDWNSRISRYTKSNGAFAGWKGNILTAPTGGANPASCLGLSPGAVTPTWCYGGTSTYGYALGAFDYSGANAFGGMLSGDSTYLYVPDQWNARIQAVLK